MAPQPRQPDLLQCWVACHSCLYLSPGNTGLRWRVVEPGGVAMVRGRGRSGASGCEAAVQRLVQPLGVPAASLLRVARVEFGRAWRESTIYMVHAPSSSTRTQKSITIRRTHRVWRKCHTLHGYGAPTCTSLLVHPQLRVRSWSSDRTIQLYLYAVDKALKIVPPLITERQDCSSSN